MKKTLATVACALAVVLSLSIVPGKKLGILGVDVVSAATGETPDTNTKTSTKTTYSTSSTISRVLKSGSKGNDVKSLQTLLNNNGYKLTVDGIFGSLTLNAVKDYQGKNGLAVDGMVGPKTLAKISPATTSTTTTTSSQITRLLKLGSKGDDVKLLQTWLNNNGNKLTVDGIFGNLTLTAVKNYQSKNGLAVDGLVGPKTLAKITPAATAPATPAAPTTPTTPTTPTVGQTTIKVGRSEYAAHGTNGFAVAVVAMAGDKIVSASVDEYQFMDPTLIKAALPNTAGLGANYKDVTKMVLASKLVNTEYYSNNMATKGKATQTWDKNIAGVEKFAIGKTVAELDAAIKANKDASGKNLDANVDAVSGATFTDTNGYLTSILEAAKNVSSDIAVSVDSAKLNTLKIGRANYAAHGTNGFAVSAAVTVEDKIVGVSVDEYQFMDPALIKAALPNTAGLGANYKDVTKMVLASKLRNTEYYSGNMASKGKATQTWDKNIAGVEKFAIGKTAAELDAAIKANKDASGKNLDANVDAVSGATFTDTNGYLTSILEAVKNAK